MHSQGEIAVIVGAGPAGLTAAYELLTRTKIHPIVIEHNDKVGGISRTEVFEGNRIDLGGHRFFSKSSEVMTWWLDMLPIEKGHENDFVQEGHTATPGSGPSPRDTDDVMLVRSRKSRIYWRRKLLDYPLKMSLDTMTKIGLIELARSGLSYSKASLLPRSHEDTLEDFLINRFGRRLYKLFFQSYTEKVWGVPCNQIDASWGAQRIKGLSILKAVEHALKQARRRGDTGLAQRATETSLIEKFLYPKFGPGHFWEKVASRVVELGGELHLRQDVIGYRTAAGRITQVEVKDQATGEQKLLDAHHVISTTDISGLLRGLQAEVPAAVRAVSDGLVYRDFLTVGLLVDRLLLSGPQGQRVTDNWIYIQEPGVQVGRLQIFNNWSPWLVQDPSKIWLGLEYFCFEKDPFWSRADQELVRLGARELAQMGIVDPGAVKTGCVIRVPKTYPAYFGTYSKFNVVRDFLDTIPNLWCCGRNGQHRYNNQDHSMLTAMRAVDCMASGTTDRKLVWEVNTEQDYHEEQS